MEGRIKILSFCAVVGLLGCHSEHDDGDAGNADAAIQDGGSPWPEASIADGGNLPSDAGADSGALDASTDAGPLDASTDAGPLDASTDAGPLDASTDAGHLDASAEGGTELDGGTDAGDAGGTTPLPIGASDVSIDPTGRYMILADGVTGSLLEVDLEQRSFRVVRGPANVDFVVNPNYEPGPNAVETEEFSHIQDIEVDWQTGLIYAFGRRYFLTDGVYRIHFLFPTRHMIELDRENGQIQRVWDYDCDFVCPDEPGGKLALGVEERWLSAVSVEKRSNDLISADLENAQTHYTPLEVPGVTDAWLRKGLELLEQRALIMFVHPSSGQATLLSHALSDGSYDVVSGYVPVEGPEQIRGTGPQFTSPVDISLDPARQLAYVARADELMAVSLDSGDRWTVSSSGSAVGEGPSFGNIRSISFDATGDRIIVLSELGVTAVDPDSGTRTRLLDGFVL